MKYSARKDRGIRNTVRRAKPYESRRSIKSRYDVSRMVDKFSSGLGSYGPGLPMSGKANSEDTAYKPLFSAKTSNEEQLLDKYYISSHLPPRDILTELGNEEGSGKSWLPLALLTIAILFLFRS